MHVLGNIVNVLDLLTYACYITVIQHSTVMRG